MGRQPLGGNFPRQGSHGQGWSSPIVLLLAGESVSRLDGMQKGKHEGKW